MYRGTRTLPLPLIDPLPHVARKTWRNIWMHSGLLDRHFPWSWSCVLFAKRVLRYYGTSDRSSSGVGRRKEKRKKRRPALSDCKGFATSPKKSQVSLILAGHAPNTVHDPNGQCVGYPHSMRHYYYYDLIVPSLVPTTSARNMCTG